MTPGVAGRGRDPVVWTLGGLLLIGVMLQLLLYWSGLVALTADEFACTMGRHRPDPRPNLHGLGQSKPEDEADGGGNQRAQQPRVEPHGQRAATAHRGIAQKRSQRFHLVYCLCRTEQVWL